LHCSRNLLAGVVEESLIQPLALGSSALRNEVRPFGIDVIVIDPGGIETEWAGIAADEVARYSGKSACAGLAAKFRKLQSGQRRLPPPRVISDLVVSALKAKRPRTRYHAGLLAGPMLFLRHHVSDRLFDRLITSAMR
jgi:NAD(P)-dependent dehydrogenase (short-subunit alcohol dehydrogenase family)